MEERSAGAVVFRETPSSRVYLLLKYPAGHWDFPKGNIEAGEAPLETMVREVREETGLTSIRMVDGFKNVIEYYYNRDGKRVHKQVTFFFAEPETEERVTLSFEHRSSPGGVRRSDEGGLLLRIRRACSGPPSRCSVMEEASSD